MSQISANGPSFGYKHLSGHAKRKKKQEEAIKNAELKDQANKFFKNFKKSTPTGQDEGNGNPSCSIPLAPCHSPVDDTNVMSIEDKDEPSDSELGVNDQISHSTESELRFEDEEATDQISEGHLLSMSEGTLFCDDPGRWPLPITPKFRRMLVMRGAVQRIQKFYPERRGYAFDAKYFEFQVKGNFYKREWLVYSTKKNSLFCFPCSLFSQNVKSGSESPFLLSQTKNSGYRDFHHKQRGISKHESSQLHFSSMMAWKSFVKAQTEQNLMDDVSEKKWQLEVQHWKNVLQAILDSILFLAKNNLALSGQSSDIDSPDCGNFLSLVKLLSKYYSPLQTHVKRLRKSSVSYMSPEIQNEFINLCGINVRTSILKEIRTFKYFAIMFDATPDSSKKEQISQVVRTVVCKTKGCEIREYFIDFITSEVKTGEGISKCIIQKLESDILDIKNCLGQGYDNGSNMSGAYKGVQQYIRKVSPLARYLPCAAHSLNLVGVNAADRVGPAKLLLGQVQNIYIFFHSSTTRWQHLSSFVQNTPKGQSTTRWSSRAEAVRAITTQYHNFVEALVTMSTNKKFNSECVAGAASHLDTMMTFQFLFGLTIWNSILFQIELCNQLLQRESGNLDVASKKLKGLLALLLWLKEFCTNGFSSSYKKAKKVADELGISITSGFEDKRSTRMAKRKRLDEGCEDSIKGLSNMKQFELFYFNSLMDNLITEINGRFQEMKQCQLDFGFLWGSKLSSLTDSEIEKFSSDLSLKYSEDLDGSKLSNEVKCIKHQLSLLTDRKVDELGPLDILNTIYKHELEPCFPNVSVALRILLTLPVTVASNERSFSKLKLIKNYLRSRMGQEQLSNLSILSIEHEVTNDINFEDIISSFAEAKCRRVQFK